MISVEIRPLLMKLSIFIDKNDNNNTKKIHTEKKKKSGRLGEGSRCSLSLLFLLLLHQLPSANRNVFRAVLTTLGI